MPRNTWRERASREARHWEDTSSARDEPARGVDLSRNASAVPETHIGQRIPKLARRCGEPDTARGSGDGDGPAAGLGDPVRGRGRQDGGHRGPRAGQVSGLWRWMGQTPRLDPDPPPTRNLSGLGLGKRV